jgi:hypothetical protein
MSNIHTEVTGQEVQSSSDMFIGEGASLNDPRNIPGFRQTTNFQPKYAVAQQEKKKGKIAKFFSNMSRLGMVYDDKVIDNMRAIPADKNFLPKQEQLLNQDLFTQLNSSWKQKQNADRNFFEKDYPQKREAFRKLALQPELEDILDVMTNEDLTLDEMLQLIYVGFKVNNPDIKFSEFQDLILDSDEFGYVEVQMEFQVFCNLLLSKKETEDEIRKKLNDALNKKKEEVEEELKN